MLQGNVASAKSATAWPAGWEAPRAEAQKPVRAGAAGVRATQAAQRRSVLQREAANERT
jgi:hypothetical protein